MSSKKIAILGTGGTIAGRSSCSQDNIAYTAAQVGVEQLLFAIPALDNMGNFLVEQVAQLDSKDMSFEVWLHLAERVSYFLSRDDVDGVVIMHGTDTLEETAYFLQVVVAPAKPVVLTCAMRPSTSLVPDGPQNILDAVAVVRQPTASGVVVVCAGTIHSAFDVQKVHTYQLDAFSSGDAGVLGFVEEGSVRLLRSWTLPASVDKIFTIEDLVKKTHQGYPRVEIVLSHACASGLIIEALLAHGIDGIVVATTGNGTLHCMLEKALLQAHEAGVKVIRATRCINGRILSRPDDFFADSKGLSPVKTRIALILELIG